MLNKDILIQIFRKLLDEAKKAHDELNAIDGKIGDGDLGITILHGLEEINLNFDKFSADMSNNFMICSQAFVKKSGSSFGTLVAFSFMNISKLLKGKNSCNHAEIIKIFETGLSTILERGKTNLGDKTIADSLNSIVKKLQNEKNYTDAIKEATAEALNDFKGRKIKIGRARMFEDKTKDLDDPGMYALYLLCSKF